MKQLTKSETTITLFSTILIMYLVFSPILCNIAFAFAVNQTTPFLLHNPVKAARYGQDLVIKTHVGNPAAVQKVTLILTIDGQVKRGKMVEIASAGNVPITVQARSKTPVFSGPGSKYTLRGYVQPTDVLQVTESRSSHYRIKSGTGINGYIAQSSVQILSTGKAYGVSLPASLTSREKLTYQIQLVDKLGRITTTEEVDVKLLTPEQVQNLMAKRNKTTTASPATQTTIAATRQKDDPVYKKSWFWLGLLAIGGGAYFILSQDQSDSDTGTLDVLVEWE